MSQNSPSKKVFDIEFLKNFTKESECHLESYDFEQFEISFQIKPKDFLSYAKYDLENKYNHHLINSYSNIKRAIDCQLDSLLAAFNLFEKSKRENWHFPDKIDCLNELGVISPRILNKINQKRNLLEHEYISPDESNVEDALDVATLFLAYIEKFLDKPISYFEFYNDKIECGFEVKLDYENNKLIIYDRWEKYETKEISLESEEYLEYLKWFINLYKLKL